MALQTGKQQGGTMQQNNIEQQVTQLVQAAASGDQKATQQIEQIMQAAQQGDQQAVQIAQIIQKVIETMKQQQGIKAKLGAKLDYIRKIKGLCPEGEELVYMKQGGRICPVCQKKAEKAKDGNKLPKKNAISDFKEKRKQHVNPNDTVHVGGKPKSLTNSDGSRVDKRFPAYTAKDYQNDKKTKDGQKRRMKADLVSSEKCGAKMKKK